MKRKMLLVTVCLLLSSRVFATVIYIESINDVFFRGSHELFGPLRMSSNGNDFVDASHENPIFLAMTFDKGAVLSHTLVDLAGDDPDTNRPIFLPLVLHKSDEMPHELNAPPDTVAIVRWVAGEDTLWLRIQAASSTWVRIDSTTVGPPEPDYPVSWSIGISARLSWSSFPGQSRNLPFATRNPDVLPDSFEQAVSTLFCCDLAHSTLETSGLDSHVNYDIIYFDRSAEVQPGEYVPGNMVDVPFAGDFSLARGKRRECKAVFEGLQRKIEPCASPETGLSPVQNTVAIDLFCAGSGEKLWTRLHDGAYITLPVDDGSNYGFGEEISFLGEDIPEGILVADPGSAFTLEGRTLYRRVDLFWNGGTRELDHFQFTLAATLHYSCNEEVPTDLKAGYAMVIPSNEGVLDEPPFDGDYQAVNCTPIPVETAAGVWRLGEVGGSRTAPHVTSPNSGFTTGLIFANTNPTPTTFTLFPFARDGSSLPTVTQLIKGSRTLFSPVETIFATGEVSHFRILAEDGLIVTTTYQADREDSGPAHVAAKSEEATRWRIYPGNPELTWDGIAAVNRGGLTTEVRVTHFDAAGEILADDLIAAFLDPESKALAVLGNRFESVPGSYYEISSHQPLSLVSLRGDLSSSFLWENQAIPIR